MNKNTQFAQGTMVMAKEVQHRYKVMGSPGTQNVRNPFPMKTLVAKELPLLSGPDTSIHVTRMAYLTENGKSFFRGLPDEIIPAREVFPKTYWEENAVSVKEISSRLLAKGYIVRAGNVGNALNNLGRESNMIGKILFKGISKDGWPYPYHRYFLVKS